MKQAMIRAGMAVKAIWVANPQAALNHLNESLAMGIKLPIMILLDLYLPSRESGWQLLQDIKALPEPVPMIPIILLSHSSDSSDISGSYNRGISSYLVKPSDFDSWTQLFQILREYWQETVALPNLNTNW
ncbi:hypothetical protein GCM10028804_33490 [Larkinella terrae]